MVSRLCRRVQFKDAEMQRDRHRDLDTDISYTTDTLMAVLSDSLSQRNMPHYVKT